MIADPFGDCIHAMNLVRSFHLLLVAAVGGVRLCQRQDELSPSFSLCDLRPLGGILGQCFRSRFQENSSSLGLQAQEAPSLKVSKIWEKLIASCCFSQSD